MKMSLQKVTIVNLQKSVKKFGLFWNTFQVNHQSKTFSCVMLSIRNALIRNNPFAK